MHSRRMPFSSPSAFFRSIANLLLSTIFLATMRTILIILLFVFTAVVFAQNPTELAVMPLPSSIKLSDGEFALPARVTVSLTGAKGGRLNRAADRFLAALAKKTGAPMTAQVGKGEAATVAVHIDHASKDVQEVGDDESYTVEITPSSIRIHAPTTLGVYCSSSTEKSLPGDAGVVESARPNTHT
jgi:hexosaminidase